MPPHEYSCALINHLVAAMTGEVMAGKAMTAEEGPVCGHCGALNSVMETVCCFCGKPIGDDEAPQSPLRGDLVRGSMFARGPRDPFVLRFMTAMRAFGAWATQEDVLVMFSFLCVLTLIETIVILVILAAAL